MAQIEKANCKSKKKFHKKSTLQYNDHLINYTQNYIYGIIMDNLTCSLFEITLMILLDPPRRILTDHTFSVFQNILQATMFIVA